MGTTARPRPSQTAASGPARTLSARTVVSATASPASARASRGTPASPARSRPSWSERLPHHQTSRGCLVACCSPLRTAKRHVTPRSRARKTVTFTGQNESCKALEHGAAKRCKKKKGAFFFFFKKKKKKKKKKS